VEESIAGKIMGVSEQANLFLGNIHINRNPFFLLDIILVAVFFYWIIIFLRETRAMRILYGLFLLLILMAIGNIFELVLLNWILRSLMTMLTVAIPIVFQPELRTALEKLGRTKFIGELIFSKYHYEKAIDEVVSACEILSKKKTGGLIIFQRQTGLKEFIENGIMVDAAVTKEMLLSIFFPRSPLHDGAVIIAGGKIVSAASTLPVTEANVSFGLGTRHKAAIGITESSDAIAVVVSEETGSISIAIAGKLERRISSDRLKARLVASLIKQKKNA